MIQSLKNLYHRIQAYCAVLYFRHPSMAYHVVGVTGTDGKTTTATLIYEMLRKKEGCNPALISTISAKIGSKEYDTGFHVTTPDPWELQKFLDLARKEKVTHLVLEVTSHALDQHRIEGIVFETTVLTNVSHEHLDYHKTYEAYLHTKEKLLKRASVAVVNIDDRSYQFLGSSIRSKKNVVTYGIYAASDFRATDISESGDQTQFALQRINTPVVRFQTTLPGLYNVYNILAAVAVAKKYGVSDEAIGEILNTFQGLTGRMERISDGQDFTVIVDFAHTPNALQKALEAVRTKTKGRVIVVFGCAGLRDHTKRPMMGKIACQLADVAVLTAEDPRTEKLEDILHQIATGCKEAGANENKEYILVPDRREAIFFAVNSLAKTQDTVLITGKGHEQSMCFGHTETPWSDQSVAKEALSLWKKNHEKNEQNTPS